MTDRLAVWLRQRLVGYIDRSPTDDLTFHYDDGYRNAPRATPLSLSMPTTTARHQHAVIAPWIDNLLPDDDGVRERWARTFGERRTTSFNLLRHVGADCAGAVQLLPPGVPPDEDGSLVPLSEADIAARLHALHDDSRAWTFDDTGGRWSLGGQQGKFALARAEDGSWHQPTGALPSTHIFKVGIAGVTESDLAEYATMRAARNLGLFVSDVALGRFEDQVAVVVERFDRFMEHDGRARRIHQEDACQALGLPRTAKYQADGGPSLGSIADLLGSAVRPQSLDTTRQRLAESVIFNWLTAGTDAHAKNYAVLLVGNRTILAPFYDLTSAVMLWEEATVHFRGKLAMKIGGRYDLRAVGRRELEKCAIELSVDGGWMIERTREMREALVDAVTDAITAAGDLISPQTGARFTDRVAARAARLATDVG